jgi:hypothetical protein
MKAYLNLLQRYEKYLNAAKKGQKNRESRNALPIP